MKELDLSWCEDVTDRGLSAVASSCSALQLLGMRQCSVGQDTLYSLATTCHFMTSLNIAGIDTLTDKMLGSLARNMPLLMEVDVSWNSSLTDSGIAALLLHCCKLKEAVLNGLKFITSTPFLSIIADLQRWHLLEELWKNQKKPRSVASKGRVAFKVCNLVRFDLISSETRELIHVTPIDFCWRKRPNIQFDKCQIWKMIKTNKPINSWEIAN